MRKKTIGEVLGLARKSQGLSLREIEEKTDIQLPYLEALENNDFDALPSSYYTRSFLKKYAQAVDLDADIILDAYERGVMITYDEVEVYEDEREDQLRRSQRKSQKNYTPLYYFSLISLSILLFVTYFIWSVNQNKPSSSSATSETTMTSSSLESKSSEETASSTQINHDIQVTGEGSNLAVAVSGVSESVNLTITAGENPSWISVSDTDLAGGITLSSTNPSVSTRIDTDTTTQIVLGNTEGITIKINDQTVDLSALTSLTGTIRLTITE